jgi:LPXTG-motif cell wall-anchored protein
MESSSRRRPIWLAATISAFLLIIGSMALAAPASADPSPQGTAHSQAHAHHATPPAHGHGHTTAGAHEPRGGGSAVSLPRPNSFQAQADPDGMENGGVDQPGGEGGVDPTSQDGNNGSGNDTDCEDDNNGVGVPGHCKDRPDVPETDTPTVPETDNPVIVPDQPEIPGIDVDAPVLDATVAAATVSATRPLAQAGTSAPPATGVLPDTGAGQALLSLALAGSIALLLGGALVRRGRRVTA